MMSVGVQETTTLFLWHLSGQRGSFGDVLVSSVNHIHQFIKLERRGQIANRG